MTVDRPGAAAVAGRLATGAALLIAALVATGWLLVGSSGTGVVQPFDDAVRRLTRAHLEPLGNLASFLAVAGSTVLIAVAAAAATGLIWWRTRDPRRALLPLIAVLTADLVGAATKVLVARPRPSDLEIGLLEHFSFPSGHTEAAVAFVTGLSLVWVQGRSRRSARIGALAVAVVALVVSTGRIVVDAHWATDVIAGCVVGTSSAFVARWALGLAPARRLPDDGAVASGPSPASDDRDLVTDAPSASR